MNEPPDAVPRVDLRDLFLALQEELGATLHAGRVAFDHPTAKGETSELDWTAMLETYLPARYRAGRAFVVDADGRRSEQIDLVLYDRQYCPLLFHRQGHLYIPAESVYAVFEVKQTLNAASLRYAAGKADSVRRLRRTSAPIPHAGGTYPPRPLFEIVAGLLAFDCKWKGGLPDRLSPILASLPPLSRLQLGCALQDASFQATYDADGRLDLQTSDRPTALVHFFFSLLRLLQSLATAPAIDLAQYGAALGSGGPTDP